MRPRTTEAWARTAKGESPGHSFVLIDKEGEQRWYGEYPSMWLALKELLRTVENHLPG